MRRMSRSFRTAVHAPTSSGFLADGVPGASPRGPVQLGATRPHAAQPISAPALPRSGALFGQLLMLIALLAGCGGGAETEVLQQAAPIQSASYTGPPPSTPDTQSFQIELWENVRLPSRCGACHTQDGQVPRFARSDDVNLAYEAANGIVDLASPGDSLMVTYVGGGHNCWLDSDAACADILTTWIENWAGGASDEGRAIMLQKPVSRDVGSSLAFPADPMLFAATVYPPLATYCAECHSTAVTGSVSPFFADADLATAYDAARSLINLSVPELSRVVVRLRSQFHNCWSDCAADAQLVEDAIIAFAAEVPANEVDPSLVVSKALTLPEGIVAAGGNRIEGNQIALFEFKEGEGVTAFDTSGVDPAVNLSLSGDVDWVGGWGIELRGGKAQASTSTSRKLHDLIRATGEYSLEAWVVPGNVNQDNAHIVSYSGGTGVRNFTLGQDMNSYEYRNRSAVTDPNGDPVLATDDDDRILQATLQHVVASFDPVRGRQLHVNGTRVPLEDPEGGALINDWDDTFALVLGNEVSGNRTWQGVLRMVAIHNRVLTDEQVQQNMDAGVGEKFFMLFDVSVHVGVPDSYVLVEVSRFDSYAYLFTEPRLLNLNGDTALEGVRVSDLRIGINGSEAGIGQAFRSVDLMVGGPDYSPETGQLLSSAGTVIALERGPEADEFFISFGAIGDSVGVTVDAAPPVPSQPADLPEQSRIGLRTFDRLDATMATLTGVPRTEPAVRATFELVREQLPGIARLDTFVSAHQIGVMQLAIEYCNALIESPPRRAALFPQFDFDAGTASAFGPAGRDALLDPLIDRMMGTELDTQPDVADVRGELEALIDRMLAAGGTGPERTRAIGKATCSAMLSSAPMLVL